MHETVKPLDDVILKYRGTHCRVKFWGHPEKALVILSEFDEIRNKSFRTASLEIAAEVVRSFRLDWLGVTWILGFRAPTVVHSEIFSQVEMKWTGEGFTEPLAREISPGAVKELIQKCGQIVMP